jgi:hypothetical protein
VIGGGIIQPAINRPVPGGVRAFSCNKSLQERYLLKLRLALMVSLVMVTTSCKKTISILLRQIPLTNYWTSLQVGKYITYRMDSLNFYYYGQIGYDHQLSGEGFGGEADGRWAGATVWLVSRVI